MVLISHTTPGHHIITVTGYDQLYPVSEPAGFVCVQLKPITCMTTECVFALLFEFFVLAIESTTFSPRYFSLFRARQCHRPCCTLQLGICRLRHHLCRLRRKSPYKNSCLHCGTHKVSKVPTTRDTEITAFLANLVHLCLRISEGNTNVLSNSAFMGHSVCPERNTLGHGVSCRTHFVSHSGFVRQHMVSLLWLGCSEIFCCTIVCEGLRCQHR